jgi:hypothetical protein
MLTAFMWAAPTYVMSNSETDAVVLTGPTTVGIDREHGHTNGAEPYMGSNAESLGAQGNELVDRRHQLVTRLDHQAAHSAGTGKDASDTCDTSVHHVYDSLVPPRSGPGTTKGRLGAPMACALVA